MRLHTLRLIIPELLTYVQLPQGRFIVGVALKMDSPELVLTTT